MHFLVNFLTSTEKTKPKAGETVTEIYNEPTITTTTSTVLRSFFRDHSGQPVPEENFWTSWCKEGNINRGRHNGHPAGRHSIRTTRCPSPPSPIFFTGRMPFVPPNQQCQSSEGKCQTLTTNYYYLILRAMTFLSFYLLQCLTLQ